MSDSYKPSSLVYLASFAALLGALSMGLAIGWNSPALFEMNRALNSSHPEDAVISQDKAVRDGQESRIGASLAVGALAGGLLTGPSNNLLGRRMSLIIYCVPFILGWVFLAAAKSDVLLIIGRLITGLCCGLVSGTAPTYVVEITTPTIRGLLGTCFQVMVVIGIWLPPVIALIASWRTMTALCILPSVLMIILMYFMPETPQWLLSKSRNEEAEASLVKLRNNSVGQELSAMAHAAVTAEATASESFMVMITNREFFKPMLLSLGLMFFQQFSGINAVLFYQSKIFELAAPKLSIEVATIGVCTAQVIATIIASFLVDKLGRKILLITSGAGHAISLVVFGWFTLQSDEYKAKIAWLALVSLITFICSFSFGFGPVPWMMIPEISSARVRSSIASIATAFNWFCVFVVSFTFKDLLNALGGYTYFIYAVICCVSCAFVIFGLPETKGKTSDQIQAELLSLPQPRSQVLKKVGAPQDAYKEIDLSTPVA